MKVNVTYVVGSRLFWDEKLGSLLADERGLLEKIKGLFKTLSEFLNPDCDKLCDFRI